MCCAQRSLCLFLGWNHRGVYVLSRTEKLENKVKRKLSTRAHRRMRMDYHRQNIFCQFLALLGKDLMINIISRMFLYSQPLPFNFRAVNTTICNPDDFENMKGIHERWHPHRRINRASYRAPIHPYISRNHRRNLKVLD